MENERESQNDDDQMMKNISFSDLNQFSLKDERLARSNSNIDNLNLLEGMGNKEVSINNNTFKKNTEASIIDNYTASKYKKELY